MLVGRIGMKLGLFLQKTEILSEFDSIYRRASLLTKQNITCANVDVIVSPSSLEKKFDVVNKLLASSNCDLSTVHEYCYAFELPSNHVLIAYFNKILTDLEKCYLSDSENLEEDVKCGLKHAEFIIKDIKDEELILKNLNVLLEKVGPYSYEIFLFIEEQLLNVSSNIQTISCASYELNIKLLKFLKVYRRISVPLEEELNYWRTFHPTNSKLPSIAFKRLPFNAFFKKSPYNVIDPELNANTVPVWLKIAPLLKISSDQLIIVAVQNEVNKYLEKICDHIVLNPDKQFVSSINNMLVKISVPEMAVGCASWVTNRMPAGGNRVLFATMTVNFAAQWSEVAPASQNVKQVHKKLDALRQHLAIERELYKYNIATEAALCLISSPYELVEHLIENYSSIALQTIKVCRASVNISSIVDINLKDIFLKFINKWLNVSGSSLVNLNESLMLNGCPEKKDLEESICDENILRTIHLFLGLREIESWDVFELLKMNLHEMDLVQQCRCLFCLIPVLGFTAVAEIIGGENSEAEKTLVSFMCIAELESLGLPFTVKMLANNSKLELIHTILSRHFSNLKALILCIRICLEYGIWDYSVWELILKYFSAKSVTESLQAVLPSVQGKLMHLWHSETFISAWKSILQLVLKDENAAPKGKILKLSKALLRCPCTSAINPEILWNEIKNALSEEKNIDSTQPVHDVYSLFLVLRNISKNYFK
ncbi:uncharacterized protein LOC118206099 isoform X2 [Stegodyphus dumicola]|nr:uncharacterized protein LOC118206099 isoform X2 [Stegodyphus dumicola]XP_035234261.1 uncharacterized protein LOC118206099 isoform X2 [Stegodyphus dumicola]